MGRSGTSALARVISLCGGALPVALLEPNFGNPRGYWEPLHAIALNDEFLRAQRSSWYDPGLEVQARAQNAAGEREFVGRIVTFLRTGFEPAGPLVLKEPRIAGLVPYWAAAADAAGLTLKVVHVYRAPGAVAASLLARDALRADHSLALWLKYNLVAERDLRGRPRAFVSYAQLMRDWESTIARCGAELDLRLTVEERTRTEVGRYLAPELNHHRPGAPEPAVDDPRLTDWAGRVHRALEDTAAGFSRSAVLDSILAAYSAAVVPGAARWCRYDDPPTLWTPAGAPEPQG